MPTTSNNSNNSKQQPNIVLLIIGIILVILGIYHMTQGTQRTYDDKYNIPSSGNFIIETYDDI